MEQRKTKRPPRLFVPLFGMIGMATSSTPVNATDCSILRKNADLVNHSNLLNFVHRQHCLSLSRTARAIFRRSMQKAAFSTDRCKPIITRCRPRRVFGDRAPHNGRIYPPPSGRRTKTFAPPGRKKVFQPN
jgi:hypothetical protein